MNTGAREIQGWKICMLPVLIILPFFKSLYTGLSIGKLNSIAPVDTIAHLDEVYTNICHGISLVYSDSHIFPYSIRVNQQ